MGVVCKLLLIMGNLGFFPVLWRKIFLSAIKITQCMFVLNLLVLSLFECAVWCLCFPRLSWLYLLRLYLLLSSGKKLPSADRAFAGYITCWSIVFFFPSIIYSYKTGKKNSKAKVTSLNISSLFPTGLKLNQGIIHLAEKKTVNERYLQMCFYFFTVMEEGVSAQEISSLTES